MALKHVTSRPLSAIRDDLHRHRIERNWTYDQLAAAIGVSRRNLFRFMNDSRARVRDTWLGQIVRYLAEQQGKDEQRASA